MRLLTAQRAKLLSATGLEAAAILPAGLRDTQVSLLATRAKAVVIAKEQAVLECSEQAAVARDRQLGRKDNYSAARRDGRVRVGVGVTEGRAASAAASRCSSSTRRVRARWSSMYFSYSAYSALDTSPTSSSDRFRFLPWTYV